MPCANADRPATDLVQTVAEEAVLCLINEQRAANGVPALALNLKLRDAARLHAAAAKSIQWWAGGGSKVHINPETGSTPQSRIRAADYCPSEIEPPPQTNENCYDGWYSGNAPAQTPRDAVDWWMQSSGHRHTLLDPVYGESGVAVVLGIAEKLDPSIRPAGGVIVVQTFGACEVPDTVTPSMGQVWAWGNNEAAQLGDDTTIDRPTPVRPHGLSGVVALAAGNWHSLALKNDGSVWAWGLNTHGQLGDGAGSLGTLRKTPVQVSNLSDVVAIAAGIFHSLALKNDGSVWAWGDNAAGQLGDGTNSAQFEPVKLFIPDITGAVAIAAGYHHSLLLTTNDGSVWAWGRNKWGQLGDATTTDRNTPAPVNELRNVAAIAAGARHSLALLAGEALAWGDNANGQLGDGTLLPRSTPGTVHFSSTTLPVVAIAAGGFHSLAVSKAGGINAYAWGANAYGQLGAYDYDDHWLPGGVGGLIQSHVLGLEVIALAGGLDHSLALMDNGSVWAWGRNSSGELGDGTITPYRKRAEQVVNVSGVVGGFACGTDCSLTP